MKRLIVLLFILLASVAQMRAAFDGVQTEALLLDTKPEVSTSEQTLLNGRVYDPQTGRFLSTDPVVQDPENMQNYNRYSYCLNDPLIYIDPSGYTLSVVGSKSEVQAINTVINNTANLHPALAYGINQMRLDRNDIVVTSFSNIQPQHQGVASQIQQHKENGVYVANNNSDAANGRGTGGVIYINTNSKNGPEVVFSHEGDGHAYAAMKGQADHRTIPGQQVRQDEYNAVRTENLARTQNTKRTDYSGIPVPDSDGSNSMVYQDYTQSVVDEVMDTVQTPIDDLIKTSTAETLRNAVKNINYQ